MRIEKRKISQLKIAAYHPRKDLQPTDPEYQKLKRSIQEFGCVQLIVINQSNTIIGGWQTLKIQRDLGFEEVDVAVVDLGEEREKALNIALNKIEGRWDEEKLAALLEEINCSNIEMELTGFEQQEFEDILGKVELSGEIAAQEDDYEIRIPNTAKSAFGELYKLGNHYLMCGDSTNSEMVRFLTANGERKANMLLTDPPYNVDYEGKTREKLKIQNDKMEDEQFYMFLKKAFSNAYEAMEPGAAFYIWHASTESYNFQKACRNSKLKIRQGLVWVKNAFSLGWQDYHQKHEPCLYGWKDGAVHQWHRDRTQTTVLEFDRPAKSELHPTMKPVSLFDYQMKSNTVIGDRVLDLFAGSGTTIIAAEQNGRTALCMEYDPKYVDVIIDRWEAYTGKKAEKIGVYDE
ncbi:site-specific DNA-methyltransferase [bacterium 210820-DFI.6.37]|nr:site-specific DNA-methyltransferase [bacterium 210820-DFI.6.37]